MPARAQPVSIGIHDMEWGIHMLAAGDSSKLMGSYECKTVQVSIGAFCTSQKGARKIQGVIDEHLKEV